jgi:hypothetical protein
MLQEVDARMTSGDVCKVAVQNPFAALYHAAACSPDFAALVRSTLAKHKPPWRIVLYQDGVDPSDGLAKHHSRKSTIFYWSFLEFGMDALAHEEAWFTALLTRTELASKLDGGVTQLASIVMQRFFDVQGHDMERGGASLKLHDGGAVHITAKLGVLVADEPALKEMLSCKGHAGTLPCALCMNAVQHFSGKYDGWHAHGAFGVSIAETDFSKFRKHTDASVREVVSRLHRYKEELGPGLFEEREQVLGYTYNAYSLIVDARFQLDVVSTTMYDWCHCYVCDGLADAELGLFMKVMHQEGTATTYKELGDYVRSWTFPRASGSKDALFSESACRNNLKKGTFTCLASEFLTVLPAVARYLERVCARRGEAMPHVRSMIAVLQVVEILQSVRRGEVAVHTLRIAIEGHLSLFRLAYGAEWMRPKHHYVLHLPDMLNRFSTLVGTLTMERKHKVAKRIVRNRLNLTRWEWNCMEELTTYHFWELQTPFLKTGPMDQRKPTPLTLMALQDLFPDAEAARITTSQVCRVAHGSACVGDAVCFACGDGKLGVGELVLNFMVHGEPFAVLSVWHAVDTCADPTFATYRIEDHAVVVPTASLELSLSRRDSSDGSVSSVYVPWELRGKV